MLVKLTPGCDPVGATLLLLQQFFLEFIFEWQNLFGTFDRRNVWCRWFLIDSSRGFFWRLLFDTWLRFCRRNVLWRILINVCRCFCRRFLFEFCRWFGIVPGKSWCVPTWILIIIFLSIVKLFRKVMFILEWGKCLFVELKNSTSYRVSVWLIFPD